MMRKTHMVSPDNSIVALCWANASHTLQPIVVDLLVRFQSTHVCNLPAMDT